MMHRREPPHVEAQRRQCACVRTRILGGKGSSSSGNHTEHDHLSSRPGERTPVPSGKAASPFAGKAVGSLDAALAAGQSPLSLNSLAGHWSKKLRILRLRDGCFSFLKAFASICLMRSLVTENCCPTSSSV
jgi:hypothetical protein